MDTWKTFCERTMALSEQLENRLIRVNLKVKQIPEHMGVLEEIFSTFVIKTSDLEEAKPPPPKETAPPTDQADDVIFKGALDLLIKSRQALDQLGRKLSQLDPSSETAAKLKGHLTFYIETYESNLKFNLKDNTTYPNSSEELKALFNFPSSSTEVAPNQTTPTSEAAIMDTSEEPQNEPIPTEEPYQIPPKRLACRDLTQDPKIQGPEIKNQYSPLLQMDTENSSAMPERKKQIPPFFITPNASWPETCQVLTSTADIAAALDPEKFKILNIAQLTSGRTKKPLPLFLVKIANSLVADEILKISSLHGIRVTVEKYRGRNIVSQCQRCYGFYHSSENCFLKVHCGVCAGDHPTNECKLQPDAVRKCVNCQGSHAAFYRGCPKFPKRNPPPQKRIYPTPPQRPRTKISLEENQINQQITPEGGQRTYANIIKNQKEQAHLSTNIPSKLPTNPTEVDLFSTLLKLIHREEVNGALLLIAYRAALPAIRKTNCLDEKYCIILEKYGAFLFN
ncbi:nucleic-acid-binding protein from transposon X-element [Caerostris darwini]|uniref:Nucleic-acid-binding protein from transposon X-element n=1 Tax=Caerostris darwini TaxID=1538125 RepID=A0AAV4U1Y8_9ARAC|nr:nucleic-acid-binding protein from transposon X-element [Caerostris darwini]